MLILLYDSLNLVVSGVKFWTILRDHTVRREEVESFSVQQLVCDERKMHRCTVLLKDKIVINDALIASNISSHSKIF